MNQIELIFQDVLADAEKIQCIPAPTFFEHKRADYIKKRFFDIGLENTHIDSVGNVIGTVPGYAANQKPIVISAHLDTVHSEGVNHQLTKQEGIWIGAGIGDNTIALAVLINLAKHFVENKIPRTLIFCANICEEGLGNLAGIRALVDELQDTPLFYLVVEGMGLGVIFHRGLGVARYEITIKTDGGHSWGNFGEPSAIHEMAKLISSFKLNGTQKKARSSYNFGKISGGTTINSIASTATTELDMRSEDQSVLNFLENKLFVSTNKLESKKVKVHVKKIGERPYGSLNYDHWLVKLAQDVLRSLNIKPTLVIGSTDANYPLSLGYPAICVCLTKGGNVHTPEEFIYLEPIKTGFLQLMELIIKAEEY